MSTRILEGLVTRGLITRESANAALLDANRLGIEAGQIVVERSWVADSTYADVAAEVLGVERLRLSRVVVDPDAAEGVDEGWVRQELILPLLLSPDGREAQVATIDPENVRALDGLRFTLGRRLRLGVVSRSELERLIRHVYNGEPLVRDVLATQVPRITTTDLSEHEELIRIAQENRQAADALRAIFEICVERGLLSYEEFMARTREDGEG